jgi:hypothetical protein
MTARVKRARGGGYSLKLPEDERQLLRSLPDQLRQLIREGSDPALERLFPPAYSDEPALEEEYQHYMRDDLREGHLGALAVMEETIDAERLDEDQLSAWMKALNELRLVLGTRLEVTEDLTEVDPTDPRAPGLALYGYLGWLQDQVVQVARVS